MIFNEDSKDVLPLLADKSIDLILTDPMYDMCLMDRIFFHNQFCRLAKKAVFVFMPPEYPWQIPADEYLFWVKPISTKNTSKRYSRFVEQIFVYHMEDYELVQGRHWSQYTNVFTDLVDDSTKHPFRKPVSLLERIILNSTNVGDIVLDPFAGSGSTGEAAFNTGRRFIGVERNKEYFDILKENKKLTELV